MAVCLDTNKLFTTEHIQLVISLTPSVESIDNANNKDTSICKPTPAHFSK